MNGWNVFMKIPAHKSHIPVDNVPWNVLEADISLETEMWHQATSGWSTVNAKFRRDLEPWAAPFRAAVMDVVHLCMPYVGEATYEELTKITWTNKIVPDACVNYHNDYPGDMAILWYLNAPTNCGHLVLNHDGKDCIVEVQTGDVVSIPAYCDHYTQLNKSGTDRWVMVTNVIWTANLMQKISSQAWELLYNKRQIHITNTLLEWYESNTTSLSEQVTAS